MSMIIVDCTVIHNCYTSLFYSYNFCNVTWIGKEYLRVIIIVLIFFFSPHPCDSFPNVPLFKLYSLIFHCLFRINNNNNNFTRYNFVHSLLMFFDIPSTSNTFVHQCYSLEGLKFIMGKLSSWSCYHKHVKKYICQTLE